MRHAKIPLDAESNTSLTARDKMPNERYCGTTGGGYPKWHVIKESTAPSGSNVLSQSGVRAFPWCAFRGVLVSDGSLK